MLLEAWKAFCDWSAVFLVGLTFVAGAGALITGKILGERQKAQLRQFDKDLTDARTNLAKSQRETAEVQLAFAQTLQQIATPRRIVMGTKNGDAAVRQAKFKELKKYAGTPAIVMSVRDHEAEALASDITYALRESGWKVELVEPAKVGIPQGFIQSGVQIRTLETSKGPGTLIPEPPKVMALLELLNLGLVIGPGVIWDPDIKYEDHKEALGLTMFGFKFPEGGVVITVGMKPMQEFFLMHAPSMPSAPNSK